MLLTDREWLRYLTFAMVVGGVLGATNAGALLINGLPLTHAVVVALTLTAAIALVVHAVIRSLLDREPVTEGTNAPTDTDTTDS